LAPDVRQAISNGKRSHSDAAGFFKISTSRKLVRNIVIDEAESHYCAGNFLDGSWTTSYPNCKDQIHYKALAAPSDYLTVRIDPAPARAGLASANHAAKLPEATEKQLGLKLVQQIVAWSISRWMASGKALTLKSYLLVGMTLAVSASATNLFSNSGFETRDLTGWTVVNSGAAMTLST
jgi:hypothetical protein